MTPNEAVVRAANLALLVNGDLDAVGEHFTEDYVAHVSGHRRAGGHRVVRQFMGACHGAFSDLQVEVEVLVEAGARIAWCRTLTGRHTGAFKGFPATGRSIVWRDMITSDLRDGRIAEEWVVTDLAESLLLLRKP